MVSCGCHYPFPPHLPVSCAVNDGVLCMVPHNELYVVLFIKLDNSPEESEFKGAQTLIHLVSHSTEVTVRVQRCSKVFPDSRLMANYSYLNIFHLHNRFCRHMSRNIITCVSQELFKVYSCHIFSVEPFPGSTNDG